MASGNSLWTGMAWDSQPPASNYATRDTRNGHQVLDFDADVDEAAIFVGILPRHYGGGGLTASLRWSAETATTGNVVWTVEIERINDESLDLDADSFASPQSVTAAAPGTSGQVQYSEVAFTSGAQMDSLAAGESFRLRIARDADNGGSDTMAGDAELLGVELRET